MNSEVRWKQRFQNYESSLRTLRAALGQSEYSELERAGLVQLFEISFELAWKTLKDMLVFQGFVTVDSPRSAIKQAFANGIVIDGELWLKALDGRNLFSHTYDDEMAEEAVEKIKETYAPLLFTLEAELKKRLS